MTFYGYISVGWPAKTYIYHFCADSGCHLEDLQRSIADRDGWWERVKGICAVDMPWWSKGYNMVFNQLNTKTK